MSRLKVDNIEDRSGTGITLDDTLKVDTISEKTSGSGVTIDSLLIKDGLAFSGITQVASYGPISGSSNQLETTSTTYADVPNHTISITPQDATSKIFVIVSIHTWGTDSSGGIKIVENSSGSFVDVTESLYLSSSTAGGAQHSLIGIIDHDTTSAFTIKVQGKSHQSGGSNRFRINWYDAESSGFAFEIGKI